MALISAMATLNANSKGDVGAPLTLTDQTIVTLYAFPAVQDKGKYRIALEGSPDKGTSWAELGDPLSKQGTMTVAAVATTNVRAKVIEVEGGTSTVTVHVLAI